MMTGSSGRRGSRVATTGRSRVKWGAGPGRGRADLRRPGVFGPRPLGAVSAAASVGYPVVLKPRAMAGSLGVVRVDSPAELAGQRMLRSVLAALCGLLILLAGLLLERACRVRKGPREP